MPNKEAAMNREDVIRIMLNYFEGLFPKECPNCKHQFATLVEYIQGTTRIGQPVSYDAAFGNWQTTEPVGTIAMVNCSCGTTLALSTTSMEMPLRLKLLGWLKTETERSGVSASQFMDHLRDEIRRRALNEKGKGGDSQGS